MSPFYLAVIVLSAMLILGLLLFPFWKFACRVKNAHPSLWAARGPFGLIALLSETGRMAAFIELITETAASLPAAQNDKKLLTWARVSNGLWSMAPRNFIGQVLFALGFVYFTWFISSIIFKIVI